MIRPAAAALVVLLVAVSVHAQAPAQVTRDNWGRVAAPVHGSGHPDRQGAERFAGPNQFGTEYDHAVLPNGRIVKPAGRSVQVGMNPLAARLTPDGRFLVVSNNDDEAPATASLRNEMNVAGTRCRSSTRGR